MINSNISVRSSFSTLNGRHAPSGALWCNLMHCMASQVFPVSEVEFIAWKGKQVFKPQRPYIAATVDDTDNPTIVCYCRSSCIYLPVALVDFQVEGFASCMHHVCQGGMWLCMKSILMEQSRIFVAIVLTIFGWEASLISWRRWDTALCKGWKNQRIKNKK